MCGIAGFWDAEEQHSVVEKMLKAMAHRGPDAMRIHSNHPVTLGHNRLAIIDLSEEANQPLFSFDEKQVIVFNGEIYNYLELKSELKPYYPFRTRSDTEVLLAAYRKWGKKMLERLNGMFAFVIYDIEKNELFGARDRFGVKPLYYIHEKDKLYWASEIKAFRKAGFDLDPNEKVWSAYFQFGSYGRPDETFWSPVKQLPGGHYFTFDGSDFEIIRWYDFVKKTASLQTDLPIDEVKRMYKKLLEDHGVNSAIIIVDKESL
jgi:asparagine synthase (glutamine-hydrolysing)